MYYSTKDFCKMCNVGRETLRHYEQLGFLHPRKKPNNHYRNYDEWDASIIADVKRYQSLGFSLKEIKTILNDYGLPQLTTSVENSIHLYQKRIFYYQMLCKKSELELCLLKQIPNLQSQFVYTDIPELLYISDDLLTQAVSSDRMNREMSYFDFFSPCLHIDRSYSGNEMQEDYSGWGLMIQKEYADYLGIHDGIVIPASKAICTILDAGEKGNISKKLFDPFFSHIEKGTISENHIIYANLLARTHDVEKKYHRYLYTFYPYK